MKVWIRNLLVLLVVQVLLFAFLQFSGSSQVSESTALLAVDSQAVTKLSVSDAEGSAVSLVKQDEQWVLASGLPADGSKISRLLEKLMELQLNWPVATSASTHERFEVADDKFQRRLILTGDVDTTLFFGTSPGYQQIHVRGSSDDVFAVKLATYEMPVAEDDWLDKSLLQATGEVTGVTWPEGMALEKTASGWMLGTQAASGEAATDVVNRFVDLQVLGVLEEAPSAAPSDAREILLTDEDGEYRLSFWPRESNNDHVMMSTRYPGEAFRLSNYVVEQLVPDETDLLPPAPAEGQTTPGVPEIDLNDVLPMTPSS